MSVAIDASALIAFLRDEPGAGVVESFLLAPQKGYAHADLFGMGIEERADLDAGFWRDVGRLKAVHRKVSLADCCALALARRLGAHLISADRHEFEPILSADICQIDFIR